ncbi:MAG TPA: peptidylprolyl isomerase [Nitrococcus sp.]|nr:peptidylprolyl isomerase [Nitrococcus sp.]
MRIAKGKVVAINYTLRTNGVIRHITKEDKPMEYLHGAGNILPGLEKGLEGKMAGDQFSINVPPEEGYGERDETLQQKVSASIFKGVKQLEAGMQFQAQGEDKKHFETLTIVEIDEEGQTVTLDANHPLAGQTLEYDVTVNSVRDATEDELKRGFVNALRMPKRTRYRPPEAAHDHHHDHSHSHDHDHDHSHDHDHNHGHGGHNHGHEH